MRAVGGRVRLAAGLVFALLAADTAVWWWLSGRVAAEFAAWQEAAAAQGLRVTAGAPRRAGWPLAAVAVVPEVTVAAANGASWHTGELRLVFEPWRPGEFTAIPVGAQRVQLGPGAALTVTARMLAVAVPLVPSATAVTRVEAHGVEAHGVAAQPEQGPAWAAERVALRFNATDLDLDAGGVVLPKRPPGQPAWPFGGVVESVQGHARLSAPLPAAEDWRAALAGWQRAGGRLLLSGLALDWGTLQARGDAAVQLTPQLQPVGLGSVQLTGYGEATAAMQRSGLLTPGAADVAGAVFALLAKAEPGQPPTVELPLRLENGVLSAGPVPLLRVPNFTVD